jgi:hypothetical protein
MIIFLVFSVSRDEGFEPVAAKQAGFQQKVSAGERRWMRLAAARAFSATAGKEFVSVDEQMTRKSLIPNKYNNKRHPQDAFYYCIYLLRKGFEGYF